MRFLNFDFQTLRHDESGQAIASNHFHIRRTMKLCELIIISEGTLYIHQRENMDVHAGEICILPPNEEHYGYASSDFKMNWVHFYLPEGYCLDEAPASGKISFPLHFKPARLDRIILLANLLESYDRTEQTQHMRDSLITTILAEISLLYSQASTDAAHSKRFQTLTHFIYSSLHNHVALDVKTVAEAFGYNEKYLYELFRKELHITPHRYITDCKMSIASERLLRTTDKVAAIAEELQYKTAQHFMKQFKKHFGVTPSQFRDQHTTKIHVYLDDREQ